MKSILTGILAAALLTAAAAFVLDAGLQKPIEERWQTEGVRL
jgi:hypothetical protein